MITIRHDYADKQWLTRCPDEAAEPFALLAVFYGVLCAALWCSDISMWIGS